MKKLISIILCVMVLLSSTALGDGISFPALVTQIEEEAFYGDAMISELNLSEVRSIGARAFLHCDSLQEVYIPETVTYIGENAFDEKVVIQCGLDSCAYDYAISHGNPVSLMGTYVINDVAFSDGKIALMITAASSCRVRVELMDDDQENTCETLWYEVEQAVENETIHLEPTESRDSFAMKVELRDHCDNRIGDPLIVLDYTAKYKEFYSKTPEDYEGKTVLDYGEEGFGVLNDSVIAVSGRLGDDGKYTVTSDTTLKVGDIIYVEESNALLKITALERVNGSYVVTGDSDVPLEECYQYIRFSGSFDAIDALGLGGDESLVSRGTLAKKEYKHTEEDGDFKAEAKFTLSINCDIKMDRVLFPDGYIDCETYAETKGNITYTFGKEKTISKSIRIAQGYIPTPVAGWFVELDVSIPVSFTAKASITFDTSFEAKGGIKYSTASGVSNIKECNLKSSLEAQGEITGRAGVRLGLDLCYMALVSVGVGVEVGAKITGTTHVPELTTEDVEKIHDCKLCFDVNIIRYLSLDANITLNMMMGEKEIVSKKWDPLLSDTIFEGYLSVINSEDSVHGGKITLGSGECPNYKYRTTFVTLNEDNVPVSGNSVTVYRTSTEKQVALGTSEFRAYLFPGEYRAEAYLNEKNAKKLFNITDHGKEVQISPDSTTDMKIYGKVIDNDTGNRLEGVEVTCGETTVYSDDEGLYTIIMNEPGIKTVRFNMEGYRECIRMVKMEMGDQAQVYGSMDNNTIYGILNSGTQMVWARAQGEGKILGEYWFVPEEAGFYTFYMEAEGEDLLGGFGFDVKTNAGYATYEWDSQERDYTVYENGLDVTLKTKNDGSYDKRIDYNKVYEEPGLRYSKTKRITDTMCIFMEKDEIYVIMTCGPTETGSYLPLTITAP